MNYIELSRHLKSPEGMARLTHLYGYREGMLVQQTQRYSALVKLHQDLYQAPEGIRLFSSPGRSEIYAGIVERREKGIYHE